MLGMLTRVQYTFVLSNTLKDLSKVDMLARIKGATQNAYSMSSIYDPYQIGFEPHSRNNKKKLH
jgi:hypothetical protein